MKLVAIKFWYTQEFLLKFFPLNFLYLIINTVDSRYLGIGGTLKNTSRYPYFDISDL